MSIYFLNTTNRFNLTVEVITKPLLILLTAMLALHGCGSDDKLPGGSNPGDQDPLASGTPLFYIERRITADEDELSDPLRFIGGGRLIMKARADQSAPETVLSSRICSGNCDFRDLEVSYEGDYLLFSMRQEDPDDNDNVEYTWDIWEYDIAGDSFRKVIATDDSSKVNHEITPRYLPSGDIVFASTRQKYTRSINQDTGNPGYSGLEEDRQQRALNLHVMASSGDLGSIRQITFNMSHDAYPAILPDGSILYTRWDNFNRNAMNLYRVNPDGTGNQIMYGMHSHTTGSGASDFQFIKSNILPSGELFVLARPMDSAAYGGDFITIDIDNYVDNTTPTATTNGSGPAQQSITDTSVATGSTYSTGGYYADFHPLWDGTNRALASWSLCRVRNGGTVLPCNSSSMSAPGATPATPAYGIWMLDYAENTQVPVITARTGIVITDIALGYERTAPLTFSDEQPFEAENCTTANFKLAAATINDLCQSYEGVLHIRNIYETDGALNFGGSDVSATYPTWSNPTLTPANNRPARFLRIIKGYPEPDRDIQQPDNDAFGRAGAQRMKQILGYAPIEPDGSVKVRIPANVPLMLSITDASGKRLTRRHQNWLSVRPGEVLECKGCHTNASTEPHGRFYAQPATTNTGETAGTTYTGATTEITSPFSYTVSAEVLNATMAEAKFSFIETTLSATAGQMLNLNQDPRFTFDWLDDGDALTDLTAADLEMEDPSDPLLPWYENIPAYIDDPDTYTLPTNQFCANWSYRCRIEINYPNHIQPFWEYARTNLASDMQPAVCTRCHSRVDDMAAPQVPAGQLELTSQVDTGIRMRSYEELFFADVEQEINDEGSLQDIVCTEPQEQPVLDIDGNPTFDIDGNPITEIVQVPVQCPATEGPYMSSAGAISSSRFFDIFEPGASHEDYLTPAELRVIAEWLDIGGQYYNDLFAAPEAN